MFNRIFAIIIGYFNLMFKDVWFKFYSIPVLFAVLFISFNFLVANLSNLPKPLFSDAVAHCKDVSNDRWADDERTYQDKCIDEFMTGGGDSLFLDIFVILWLAGLLFSIVGIVFVVPLSVYLLLSWRKLRYGHY